LIILHSLHHINLIYLPLVSTPYKPPSFPTRRSSDLINSTPFYLRFAKPADLQWLVPVFWIGFNVAMFPASVVVKHRGGLIVMGADRKSTRLNSSHEWISYAVLCLKKRMS